jgi:hypothetical protein
MGCSTIHADDGDVFIVKTTVERKVWRYQRGHQNPYVKGHAIQWPQDTKGVIRIRMSKDRQYNGHKIPKG